jgi:hypothetical protein
MILFHHSDGRYGLAASADLADFTRNDPGWHRVPIDEVRLGKPVAFRLDTFSPAGERIERDYHEVDEWPFGRTGGVPLYAAPSPPAPELTDEEIAKLALLHGTLHGAVDVEARWMFTTGQLRALLEARHAR